MQAANSPRPGNWILERSLDGVVYTPWQYFALTDSDCWNTYGLPPTIGIPKFQTDDQVICTSDYSRLDPLENGEVTIPNSQQSRGIDPLFLMLVTDGEPTFSKHWVNVFDEKL